MERSLSGTVNKSIDSKGKEEETPEESGWTAYFADFLSNQQVEYSEGKEEETPEESGWTAYFADFLSNQQVEYCSGSCSNDPSLISDGASYAAWKLSSDPKQFLPCPSVNIGGGPGGSLPKTPKRLSFKKTRTKEIPYDDSLEDTASSPANSPKVSSLKYMDINHQKIHDHMSSLGKGGTLTSDHYYEEQQTDFRINETNFERKNDDLIELRKRGLCLVPVSILTI